MQARGAERRDTGADPHALETEKCQNASGSFTWVRVGSKPTASVNLGCERQCESDRVKDREVHTFYLHLSKTL
jgi:hypothetical protein